MVDTGGNDPELDPVRIIETLVEHHVQFVLVGGQAALFHGAQRPTQDADVVVAHDVDNLRRLSAALNELHWRYRREGLSDEEAQALGPLVMDAVMLRDRIVETLMTDAGPLDVLQRIPTVEGESPGRDFDALAAEAVSHQLLPGLTVKLAALDHIIESKQWANRPKDQLALEELHHLAEEHDRHG